MENAYHEIIYLPLNCLCFQNQTSEATFLKNGMNDITYLECFDRTESHYMNRRHGHFNVMKPQIHKKNFQNFFLVGKKCYKLSAFLLIIAFLYFKVILAIKY